MSEATNVIGIDIGGTKIAVCVANSHGEILGDDRISNQGTYGETLPLMLEKIHGLLARLNLPLSSIRSCGICAPGPLDIAGGNLLRSPNIKWDADAIPIRDDVQKALGIPVMLENDANAGVLAEWFFGAGKGKKDVIYITMSTGVGGGVIAGGRLLHGHTGNAGELGHMIIDLQGPLCNCGLRGCLEAYCGGKAVQQRLQEALKDKPLHAIYRLPCVAGKFENLNFQAVREGAKAKIPLAMEMWDEICLRLAQGIGMWMCAFNPELIVLGTAAYWAGDFLMEPVKRYLPRFTWPDFYDHCEVRTSALGLKVGELAGPAVALNKLYEDGLWQP